MTAWGLLSSAIAATGIAKLIPISVPPATNPAWKRAETIAQALRTKGKSNPFVVAAVANGLAESAWRTDIVGDFGQSFGPWQLKAKFYRGPIMSTLGIDITGDATTLEQHVDAVLFALRQSRVVETLDAATTGAEATATWCRDFERASAPSAIDRRVAIAPKIEAWLAGLS